MTHPFPISVSSESSPLWLTTGRMLEHWHTGAMTRRATVLDALEPEAVASLNPFQLRTMGLEPGDMVKVATRRGEIALNVRADRHVPEGMVRSEERRGGKGCVRWCRLRWLAVR